MWNLMQFLGFYGDDDDYDEPEDYQEEQVRPRKQKTLPQGQKRREPASPAAPKGLILFKGIPSENAKFRLSEALREGSIILLDLHELDPRELEEQGRPFITFMGGVAYASGGRIELIEPAHYLVMPRDGIFEEWVEEGPVNDGAFDRQGR